MGGADQIETPLKRYGLFVARRWMLVLIVTGIALCLSVVWTLATTQTTWTATAAVTSQSDTRAPEQDAVLALGYADYFNKPEYQQLLRAETGIPAAVELSAKPGAASPIFYIQAVAPTEAGARDGAARAADAFREDIRKSLVAERSRQTSELQKQIDGLVNDLQTPGTTAAEGNVILDQIRSLQGRITDLSSDATNALKELQPEPGVAKSGSSLLGIGVGTVAGLILGALLAVVLGLLDDRVRRREDIERLGMPVLVDLPPASRNPQDRARTLARLAITINGELGSARGIVIAIAPASRSAVARQFVDELASLFAARRGGALVIRADFHAPSAAEERSGLVDVLDRGVSVRSVATVHPNGLVELPCGDLGNRNIYDVFAPERIAAALNDARGVARVVLLELPPLDEAPESQPACAAADLVAVVLERGVTRRRAVTGARDLLAPLEGADVRAVIDTVRPADPSSAPVQPSDDVDEPSRFAERAEPAATFEPASARDASASTDGSGVEDTLRLAGTPSRNHLPSGPGTSSASNR
ncbi:hypothetical protein LWC35_09360 [Pseudonocardia kujensis]|nr:hypothetical protein [Pseudonocardia kujensis]